MKGAETGQTRRVVEKVAEGKVRELWSLSSPLSEAETAVADMRAEILKVLGERDHLHAVVLVTDLNTRTVSAGGTMDTEATLKLLEMYVAAVRDG